MTRPDRGRPPPENAAALAGENQGGAHTRSPERERQPQVSTRFAQCELVFAGPGIDTDDAPRMGKCLAAVFSVMRSSSWLDLHQIRERVQARTGSMHSDAAISARVRDLRKPRYGGFTIERRRRPGRSSHEYRLAVEGGAGRAHERGHHGNERRRED